MCVWFLKSGQFLEKVLAFGAYTRPVAESVPGLIDLSGLVKKTKIFKKFDLLPLKAAPGIGVAHFEGT